MYKQALTSSLGDVRETTYSCIVAIVTIMNFFDTLLLLIFLGNGEAPTFTSIDTYGFYLDSI
jgi:hypothetical protein